MTEPKVRNARGEAAELVGAGTTVRVLEPSPPAVDDGDWFADDPVNAAGPPPVVSPVGGDLTWDEIVHNRPDLCDYATEHWLVGPRRLEPLPDTLVATRDALHRLGAYVIAPARHAATGRFGLRWTYGGFGTPFFGADRQLRVEGDQLVVQEAASVRSTPVTTLAAAADFIGSAVDAETAAEHDSPPVGDVEEILAIDVAAVASLTEWWGMGTAALERVRADDASVAASRVQLWPGHFDTAIEVGEDDRRASYGASPGDAGSDVPYLYVSVWWPDRLDLDLDDEYWNADGFVGARLPFEVLARSDDPVAHAADFFRAGRDRLTAACLSGTEA